MTSATRARSRGGAAGAPSPARVLGLLALFTTVLLVGLALPWGPVGPRVFLAVLAFHLGWLVLARRDAVLADLWPTLALTSALFVLPDWFLVRALGVLRFPADGFPDLGPVTGYMAGLWAVPFLAAVTAGRLAEVRRRGSGNLVAGAVCLALLVLGEAVAWRVPVWDAVGVREYRHVALYLLPAEALLGAAVLWAAGVARGRSLLIRLVAALVVVQLYAGGLALGYCSSSWSDPAVCGARRCCGPGMVAAAACRAGVAVLSGSLPAAALDLSPSSTQVESVRTPTSARAAAAARGARGG